MHCFWCGKEKGDFLVVFKESNRVEGICEVCGGLHFSRGWLSRVRYITAVATGQVVFRAQDPSTD